MKQSSYFGCCEILIRSLDVSTSVNIDKLQHLSRTFGNPVRHLEQDTTMDSDSLFATRIQFVKATSGVSSRDVTRILVKTVKLNTLTHSH